MAGDFDLSARITADASGLVSAGAQAEAAYDGIGKAGKEAAQGAKALETATENATKATTGLAAGDRNLAAAQTEAMRATKGTTTETLGQTVARQRAAKAAIDTAAAEARLSSAQSMAERSAAAAALAALKLEQAQQRVGQSAQRTGATVEAAANRQAYATRNLGQQFGDLGTQVALGGGFARAFASQAGQMGYALSEFGGTLGKVGAFLVGPWGIALTTAAVLAAPFIGKLFEGSAAAQDMADKLGTAATAADSYGNAQSILGKIIDLTTGKLKTQNAVLIQTIKLQAQANIIAAQQKQRDARDELKGVGEVTTGETFTDFGKVLGAQDKLSAFVDVALKRGQTLGPLQKTIRDYINLTNIPGASQSALDKGLNATITAIDKLGRSGRLAGRDLLDVKSKVLALGTTLNDQRANQLVVDAADGKGVDPLLKPYARDKKPKKPKAPKKPASTVARDEFGEDAADKLASLRESLSDTPAVVRQVNQQIRQLDDLIDDLARKKPPGFEKLIADAKALKPLVLDGLTKPFDDFVKAQTESLAIGSLTLQGRTDEATALRTIQQLQQTMGPLTDAQKDAVLRTTEAMRAQARAIDDLRQRNAKYIEAIGGIKGVVEGATQAFVRGDLGQLLKSPGKLLDIFQTFQGRALFDKVFGGLFQELEDQVNGTSVVKDASDRMATAVDKASASIVRLGNAADQAAGGVAGSGVAGAAGAAVGATSNSGDIIVNGKRDPIASAISKVGERVAGVFTNPESAAKIGSSIGKFASKGLAGAATGSVVAGIGKSLGIKLSGTGSQIGGAIGNFLPIPGGSIIGSLAGGLIGSLFGKKATNGSASISSDNGRFSAGTATGASSALKGQASGLAGSVAQGLQQIAEQLGGGVGSTAGITIGVNNGNYHVNAVGGQIGKKGSGDINFNDDEAGAIAYAIQQAVTKGAVTGLSVAVQQAIRSSSDVNAALAEALKVSQLEKLLGGLGNSLKAAFDAEDAAGKERVRLARSYGLDLVAVEKLNAEQRTKLVDDTLKARIGSLSDFLDNLKFGDLAEGTAIDKRNALLEKIKGVQGDAEAGKDGAADQLAQLYAQLVQNSRDAFGTAGTEYGSDRSTAQSAVERVIAMETSRVNEAAGITAAAQATTAAVQQNNALTDETNDLLAQNVAVTRDLAAQLAAKFGYDASGLGIDYGSAQRFALLT